MADRVKVTCPCCRTRLTVDTATGEILARTRPGKNASRTLEDALKGERDSGGHRDLLSPDLRAYIRDYELSNHPYLRHKNRFSG